MVNPFSTKFWQAGVIPFHFSEPGDTIDALLEKAQQHPACQIVGPHGSGKSTLLLELRKRYEQNGKNIRHLFFNDQQKCIADDIAFQEDLTFFVDGFEQLPLFKQLWLRFRARRLILTAHHPIWFMPILYRTKPQFSVFVQIVRQMVQDSPETAVLREVYERSGDNFRNAFFELYDRWEEQHQQ